jgi:hypothetical protein
MKKILLTLIFTIFFPPQVLAAVGCDLNDPDRDVNRFFPNSTGYKTQYLSIDKVGSDILLEQVEERLGDKFKGLYETSDVPYTIYTVFKNENKIGYIHGVNQKGKYGSIQVFLILDTEGIIKDLYFQKLTSKASNELKSKDFTNQFVNLSLKDFKDYDPQTQTFASKSKATNIKNSAPGKGDEDFKYLMRGIKKNLILMDVFVFNPYKKGE